MSWWDVLSKGREHLPFSSYLYPMGRQSVVLVAVMFTPVVGVVSLAEVRLHVVTVTFRANKYPPGITALVVDWFGELV
jgi:hypothetical protein